MLERGELRVQRPARWLAGVVVLAPPESIVAPALLPADASLTFVAVKPSSVVVEVAAPSSAGDVLATAVAWLRGLAIAPLRN
ncbi:hypothetical protein HK414_01710 [Ramlibacter terrae]|uniref:Uncharacterized protein n=1 Tax=Ramlibacter terrae TaxID=2732511 RepID=A0ABX6P012_9BURK|nr:hypothetical protein HK414_01710 [Ramlibacter terrae]